LTFLSSIYQCKNKTFEKVEAKWAAMSAAAPPISQALVVPLCCDWNGLNDQIALGTQVAEMLFFNYDVYGCVEVDV